MKNSSIVLIAIGIIAVIAIIYVSTRSSSTVPAAATSDQSTVSTDSTMNMSDTSATSGDTSTAVTPPVPAPADMTAQISIANFAFVPNNIIVNQGATVTWTNNDSVAHTVTGDASDGPDSQNIVPGGAYSYTFNTPGTYTYHCSIHPNMTGTITVQ